MTEKSPENRVDGQSERTDRQTDGRTDGRMDGRTDSLTDSEGTYSPPPGFTDRGLKIDISFCNANCK